MGSPTSRSLDHARKSGAMAQVVERWVPQSRRRIDLFGVIDLVVIDGKSILGVQACAGASHAARRKKALGQDPDESPKEQELRRAKLALWLASGGRFEVWSWAKQGPRGKRKLWTLRVEAITAEDVRLAAGAASAQ